MKRILLDGFIFGSSPGGGIARYFTELGRWFRENPAEEDFLAILPTSTPAGVQAALPMRSVPRRMYKYPATWRFLRPRLFHSTYYTLQPRLKCPQVVTAYDFVDVRLPGLCPNKPGFPDRQIAALRGADAVVAISESTRQDVVTFAGIPAERIRVASPGISRVFAQDPPPAESVRSFREKATGGAPFLLHVGGRGNYKNFTLLLEAFCIVAARGDTHLVLAGGEPCLSAIEEGLLEKYELVDRVQLLGRLPDESLRLAYAGAVAVVHASLMEGFGLPVVEALACGGRLVLSDLPVYHEVAGPTAIYADPYNRDEWVEALQAVLAAPWPCDERARSRAIKKYRTETTGQIHRDLYRQLMA